MQQRTGPRRRSGITLIEMMVVLMITGVVLAMGLPRIDTARYKADSVAQLVRNALLIAQRAAVSRQHDIIVSIDTAKARIRVAWDANNSGTVDSGERTLWQGLETGNRFAKPEQGIFGTVATSVVGAGLRTLDEMPTMTFHRDGSVSTGVEIYLSTAAQKVGITNRAIRVIQATGKADWYRRSPTGTWGLATL